MKPKTAVLIAAIGMVAPALSDAATARKIRVKPNQTKVVRGSIDGGVKVPLRWANTTRMGCWSGYRNKHFNGKHVFFRTRIPAHSKLIIELDPDRRTDLSLYAYMDKKTRLPPKAENSFRCEASYLANTNRRSVTSNPGQRERVELRTQNNVFEVVIGVAGAHGATRGKFKLEVTLVTGGQGGVKDSGPVPSMRVHWRRGNSVSVRGTTSLGKAIPLAWANNSSVSCWPAIANRRFNGNHYAWRTVIPARHQITIELRPDGDDLSLYAYTVSAPGKPPLPPRVRRVVSCTSSYRGRGRSRERVTLRAGSRALPLVIGVAAAGGVTRASYEMVITKSR